MRCSLLAVRSEKVRQQPRCPSAQSIEPGMQDFTSYHLIIDARSPREYADDHIPGAANLPVIDNEEYAEVGITQGSDKHRAKKARIKESKGSGLALTHLA
jgi:tRNA 2-selenouridine synthase SelU